MHIFILRIEWRILYLLYMKKCCTYEEIIENFGIDEHKLMDISLSNLSLSNVITKKENSYTINNTENHPFLKILHYIYTLKKPESRSEIRNKVKHKILQECLDELTKSGIFYEYRIEINRKVYVIPFEKKDEFIRMIEEETKDSLYKTENIHDKAHLVMINNNYPIISSNTNIDSVNLETKYERKIVTMLLEDMNKSRKYGISFDEIMTSFKVNKKLIETALLSLVEKGIVKCSRRNTFYLNNYIIDLLKEKT